MQRLKCLLGFHKEEWVSVEGKRYPHVTMQCKCCRKYGIWLPGVNAEYWARNLDEMPQVFEDYIKELNQ